MYEVSKQTLAWAHKPFDVVTNRAGDVGFIQEVSVNDCQSDPTHQITYAVDWLVGNDKHAWFFHNELKSHGNLLIKIAESACHSMGSNAKHVKPLFKYQDRK